MPDLSYEEATAEPPKEPAVKPEPAALSYEEATAAPPEPEAKGPMPGTIDALLAGMGAGWGQAAESARVIGGEKPTAPSSAAVSPAAAPFAVSDITHPSRILPKVAYQLGESFPTVGAGIAGGAIGAAMPVPGGTLIGGAAGAGLGAAMQAIGPVFGEELRKSPGDPDGAWNRAKERATASGAFSALGWAAFPLGAAGGALKQIAFQAFGVQPAIATAAQTTQNIIQGKAPTEGLGQAYVTGAAGTLVPMVGHAALNKILMRPSVAAPAPPVDEARLKVAEDKINDLQTQSPALHREAQKAYQDHGVDSPEFAYANYKIAQNRDAIREANNEFVDTVTPPAPDQMLLERVPIIGPRFRAAIDSYKRSFQPELISNLSMDADPIFRQYNSRRASGKDAAYKAMDGLRYAFTARPDADNIAWIQSATKESLAPLPPELQQHADILHEIGDWVWQMDKDAGSKLGYVKDYLPREFENPDAVNTFVNNRIQSLGPTWFQKGRTFSFLQEALDSGYKLRTTNPVDLMTNRLMSSVDMRARVKLLEQLSDMGAARKITNEGQQVNFERAGWLTVKDPVGNSYALHPDIQPLWENAAVAKGLWTDEGAAGNVFRKWMWLKNHWVPIKLGLSAFHLLHVGHIAFNDSMARGWNQALSGDISGAVRNAGQAFTGFFRFKEGQALREAWLTPEWSRTPEQKALVDLAIEGGFSPQLSEQLRMEGPRKFKEALAANNPYAYIPRGALQGATFLQKALFEHWIPNLKSAAYVREAQALFDRRPDIQADPKLRTAALSAIAKSVDNRFGEMFYSNLFWNRTLKDIGIGSFLSLGWNLGFLREFGGGALEPFLKKSVMTPTQEAVNAAKSKATFALFYMGTAMALNAAMTKAMTGEDPQGMDYFLPRYGGNNPDGSPRRLSNMYYTREVPMLKKHIEEQYGNPIAGVGEMLWNKMMLEPVHELWNNRDYYGYNIVDPASPMYQQAYQMGKYILSDQFNPITIMGAKRALQASGKWDENRPISSYAKILTQPEGQLAMLGFGPAPAYAAKTPEANKIAFLFSRYVSPMERPLQERAIMEQRRDARNALEIARQKGDDVGVSAASRRLAEAGVSVKGRKVLPGTADIYMFSRLPFTIQTQFLKDIGPEAFKRYFPKASKQTKGNPEIRDLVRQYYQ